MKLLLVGGGHSHVEVLRRFALQPVDGLELTLVTPETHAAYSGMLPGLVAGHYRHDETHVALSPLAVAGGARLLHECVVALDVRTRVATLAGGDRLAFDVVSLDIGSTPDARVTGTLEHAVRVKPVPAFLGAWERLQQEAAARHVAKIVVVGGGAGGVEILLAMQHRLRTSLGASAPRFALVTDQPQVMASHAVAVRRRVGRVLRDRDVALHFDSPATAVQRDALVVEGSRRIAADAVVWATSAAAAPWLANSGLAVDARGFVCVDEHLRSTSHPYVFAAGDCAAFVAAPHPKSGLYAVRHGPPLAANLRAQATGAPLVRYSPQTRALALIGTGGRDAILSWGPFAAQGAWVWQWKDRIDRRFMARYAMASGNPATRAA
jgi:selenide,water dikinase